MLLTEPQTLLRGAPPFSMYFRVVVSTTFQKGQRVALNVSGSNRGVRAAEQHASCFLITTTVCAVFAGPFLYQNGT